jgi:hypothetical protein
LVGAAAEEAANSLRSKIRANRSDTGGFEKSGRPPGLCGVIEIKLELICSVLDTRNDAHPVRGGCRLADIPSAISGSSTFRRPQFRFVSVTFVAFFIALAVIVSKARRNTDGGTDSQPFGAEVTGVG